MISRVGRSPFGAFIRSPFGVRTIANPYIFQADGIATASMFIYSSSGGINNIGTYERSLRSDEPYGAQVGQSYTSGPGLASKADTLSFGVPGVFRSRIGTYFTVDAGVSAPSALRMTIQLLDFADTRGEPFYPVVYISALDHSGFAPGWENDLALGPFYLQYGNTGFQTVNLDPSVIFNSVSSYNVSIVIGNSNEMTGSGPGYIGPGSGKKSEFRVPSAILTFETA